MVQLFLSSSNRKAKETLVASAMLTCSTNRLKVAKMLLDIYIRQDLLATRQSMFSSGLARQISQLKENKNKMSKCRSLSVQLSLKLKTNLLVVANLITKVEEAASALRQAEVVDLRPVLIAKIQKNQEPSLKLNRSILISLKLHLPLRHLFNISKFLYLHQQMLHRFKTFQPSKRKSSLLEI